MSFSDNSSQEWQKQRYLSLFILKDKLQTLSEETSKFQATIKSWKQLQLLYIGFMCLENQLICYFYRKQCTEI